MAREHLYRGFYETNSGNKVITLDSKQYRGEWVEGNLFVGDDGECEILIGTKVVRISYPVIPETVCEYTELIDSNKQKIFEGNIVRLKDVDVEWYAVVEFGNPRGNYSWGWQLNPIIKVALNYDILCWIEMEATGSYCEIIGNIFENPELLQDK